MYYKCYDMRYIFHVMRLLHLIHLIQSAHFVCFGHKSRPLKNSVTSQTGEIYKTKNRAKYLYFVTQHALLFLYTHVSRNDH